MKTNLIIVSALIMGAFFTATPAARAGDSAAPVVVKTVPETGATDLAPGLTEIRITFSKPMRDSCTFTPLDQNEPIAPDLFASKPRFEADRKTFVLKLNLKPGTKYGFWINSPKFKNFKDTKGRPATPFKLIFSTKAE